ncbi:hypothetical protein ACSNOK_30205 [Streptomyces sp. URMC 126]
MPSGIGGSTGPGRPHRTEGNGCLTGFGTSGIGTPGVPAVSWEATVPGKADVTRTYMSFARRPRAGLGRAGVPRRGGRSGGPGGPNGPGAVHGPHGLGRLGAHGLPKRHPGITRADRNTGPAKDEGTVAPAGTTGRTAMTGSTGPGHRRAPRAVRHPTVRRPPAQGNAAHRAAAHRPAAHRSTADRTVTRRPTARQTALCRYRPARDMAGLRAGRTLAVGFGRRQGERGTRDVRFGVRLTRDRPLGRLGEGTPGATPGGGGDGLGGGVGPAVGFGGGQRERRAPGFRARRLHRFGRRRLTAGAAPGRLDGRGHLGRHESGARREGRVGASAVPVGAHPLGAGRLLLVGTGRTAPPPGRLGGHRRTGHRGTGHGTGVRRALDRRTPRPLAGGGSGAGRRHGVRCPRMRGCARGRRLPGRRTPLPRLRNRVDGMLGPVLPDLLRRARLLTR